MNWLEKTKQKTEGEKRSLAFMWALIITIIISAFWIAGLFQTVDNLSSGEDEIKDAASPFQAVFRTIFDGKTEVYE